MAGRDYCCCQLNSPCVFGCFLRSQLSVARRGACQAPCTHLAIYSQTQQPCLLSSWNPLEPKSQGCRGAGGRFGTNASARQYPGMGIVVVAALNSADSPGNIEHLRNVVIFITLYKSTENICFFLFFHCIGCSR